MLVLGGGVLWSGRRRHRSAGTVWWAARCVEWTGYLQRHRGMGEDWSNPLTAGFYATNILWNKLRITESIRDTNRRFKNINIIYKS